ncbi:tRNA (guanine-N1)-methyltransferase [Aurantibacter sp.]|uniref:tRNA (guanine-N1)-methyltransferase n=1 Tax=Aurantibacter sp. TaxID=2807103 RepID=UPI0035C839F8
MLFKQSLSVFLFLIFTSTITFAQVDSTKTTPELSLTKSTIVNQFEYIIKKSTNWRDEKGQNYEVVKKQWIAQLRSNTLDTLKVITDKHSETLVTISEQDKNIKTLQSKLNNIQSDLDASNSKKDEISIFGSTLTKTTYNTILFSIIAVLGVLLGFFFYQFKNSNTIAKEAKHQLSEVENDFDEHRRKALEREQKVRRQLQDVINKHRGK